MKTVSASFLEQIKKGQIRPFHLFYLSFDGNEFRNTDCDVPLVIDSNRYEPRGMSTGNADFTTGRIVDSVDFTIDNVDRYFTSAFVDGTPIGGQLCYSLVLLDSNYHPVAANTGRTDFVIFEGIIDHWSLDEQQLYITATNELNRWSEKTLFKQSASCRWKEFKGPECGFTGGDEWCDRTYKRCEQLNNTDNFGGERWLPSIIDKEIWWGRKPK